MGWSWAERPSLLHPRPEFSLALRDGRDGEIVPRAIGASTEQTRLAGVRGVGCPDRNDVLAGTARRADPGERDLAVLSDRATIPHGGFDCMATRRRSRREGGGEGFLCDHRGRG